MGALGEWLTNSIASSRPGTELEVRSAPHALSSPLQITVPNQAQVPDWDGVQAVNSAYLGNLYVYRCVEATANALAGLPFRAGFDPEKPQEFSSPQYSRLAFLLSPPPGSPNPQWTPRAIWKYAIIQYIITGKWVWLKEFSPSGQLIGLWPLPSQFIEAVPVKPGSRGDKYFRGFNYRVQGRVTYIPESRVFYAWNPSQSDHLQAESVLKAASYRIGLAQMLDRYDHALMKNNCVPSTIVTTEPFATKQDRREFRQQFVSTFGGFDNAGKTIFAEAEADIGPDGSESNNVKGKIQVDRLGLTASELQQNEKYKQVVDDIHIALGTPKSVLGIATDATYANGGQELTNWWNERLLPLKAELEDHINIRLAPQLGRQVGWFDTSKVKALQPKQRFNSADIAALVKPDATNGGPLLSRDEGRAELGLPPWTEEQQKEHEKFKAEALAAQEKMLEKQAEAKPELVAPQGKPKLSLVKPDNAKAKAMVARQMANLLVEQRDSLDQRAKGRKGRKVEHLTDLLDARYATFRAVEILSPSLMFLGLSDRQVADYAAKVVEDNRALLMLSDSVRGAFSDLEKRAESYAASVIADAQPVPLDHVEVLLRAVEADKLSSSDAYTKFLEVS